MNVARKRGPKPKLTPDMERQMDDLLKVPDLTVEQIAKLLGVHRATIYNTLRRRRSEDPAA